MKLEPPSGGYKGELTGAMQDLARDPAVCFVGYGVRFGGRAGGTLQGIPDEQLIETPVAENLMVQLAMGLALKGRRPVVYIERFDFILNALDAIVNHLDKMRQLSRDQYNPAMILRVVAGNRNKPLFTGPTHTQDFTESIRGMVSFPVVKLDRADGIRPAYAVAHDGLRLARRFTGSTMLVEMKDMI